MKSRNLREQLSELEHEVAAQQQRGLELKAEIDRHESRIQFNEERLREIESQNAKALGGNHAGRGTLPCRVERIDHRHRTAGRRRSRAGAAQGKFAGQTRELAAGGKRFARAAGTVAPGAVRRVCRRAGFVAPPQRNHGARFAEAGQRRPPRKTFRRKNPAGSRTHRLGIALAGIHRQRRGGKTERRDHARLRRAAAEPSARIAGGIADRPPPSRTNFCTSNPTSVRA